MSRMLNFNPNFMHRGCQISTAVQAPAFRPSQAQRDGLIIPLQTELPDQFLNGELVMRSDGFQDAAEQGSHF